MVSAVGPVSPFLDLTVASSLIGFGAPTLFSLVDIAAVKHFVVERKRRGVEALLRYPAAPEIGPGPGVRLWTSPAGHAFGAGLCRPGLGLAHLVVIARGLRVAPADLDLAEA
ncbi:hypothetical protein ACFVH0_33165 [Streptomyces sp. NPDC127117]|uniref:hypothetical protein n=1 Tax=Streptomyces sp. NPDC127117 TaxID=3345368 RepID=UPI003629EDD1